MISFVVKLHVRGPNEREHWHARARRVKQERAAVQGSALVQLKPDGLQALRHLAKPLVVTFTRVGVRLLDDDNLAGAIKGIRDEVAVLLGTGDAPSAPVQWVYRQERGEPSVRIEVRSAGEKAA